MGALVVLGVTNPVTCFNTVSLTHQLQQAFWRGAQAGEEQMDGVKGLAVTCAVGRHLLDLTGSSPGLPYVLRRLYGS